MDEDSFFIDKKFDYIIFEHSFEHICDEHKVLERAKGLLRENGIIVMKLPQFSRYYWKRFGINQTVFDPPRHIYIHTYSSMNTLVQKHGMKIIEYSSETEPIEYIVAKSEKKGRSVDITNIPFLKLLLYGLGTYPDRHKLDKRKDGACATFVIREK